MRDPWGGSATPAPGPADDDDNAPQPKNPAKSSGRIWWAFAVVFAVVALSLGLISLAALLVDVQVTVDGPGDVPAGVGYRVVEMHDGEELTIIDCPSLLEWLRGDKLDHCNAETRSGLVVASTLSVVTALFGVAAAWSVSVARRRRVTGLGHGNEVLVVGESGPQIGVAGIVGILLLVVLAILSTAVVDIVSGRPPNPIALGAGASMTCGAWWMAGREGLRMSIERHDLVWSALLRTRRLPLSEVVAVERVESASSSEAKGIVRGIDGEELAMTLSTKADRRLFDAFAEAVRDRSPLCEPGPTTTRLQDTLAV